MRILDEAEGVRDTEQALTFAQDVCSNLNAMVKEFDEKLHPLLACVGAFQTLKAEFGISYNAMCYLLYRINTRRIWRFYRAIIKIGKSVIKR